VQDIRRAGEPLVGFSRAAEQADREIKQFLFARMYRHDRIMRIMRDAESVVRDLFEHYMAHTGHLPPGWLEGTGSDDGTARARRVADFIAGMTDRYALAEHARHFDSTPELR
jgi:dGTPase